MNKKTKICLNAMVGNEAKTIVRMLESTVPYIDYWVIQCNGNDDTEIIINKYFEEKSIPGFTYKLEWNFPGWNRNHTLQECLKTNHGCDWILRMDADERLHVDEDFDWSILDNTNIQSWNVVAQANSTKYFRTWLWNAKLPWFFANDKRHETIHLPEVGEDFERIMLPSGFRHIVFQDGQTWHVPRKFLRDALELEIDNVVGLKVPEDLYHLWYIGKSYSDCYGNPSELPFGKKHSDEYARRAIWYFERHLNILHDWDNSKTAKNIDENSYFTVIFIANAWKFIGDYEKAIENYKLASQFCPERNEHFLYWIQMLEELGNFEEILEILDFMSKPERVNPFPKYSFLIEDSVYHNTGNFISDMKERIRKKMENPIITSESFHFSF